MTVLETKGRAANVYFTAAELMETSFPKPRWAVRGLIAEGLNLLVGAPKLGKSWMVLDFGIGIASGTKVLGSVDVEQGAVLYAALEDTPRRLQSRLDKVLDGRDAPAGLHIVTSLPRGTEMAGLVSEWLDDHRDARLVIVDVLRKITPQSDGRNVYEADYNAMGELKALADRHRVAVVAVHHTRKSTDEGDVFNEVSGSTGLTGAADAILIAKRARNTSEAVLHVTGRDITERDYGLSWNADTCKWTLTDQPAVTVGLSKTRRAVLAWVEGHEGDTPTEIAEGTQIKLATVKQTVRRMVNDDQLGTDGDGHYFTTLSPVSPLSPMQVTGPKHGDTTVTQLSPSHPVGDSGDTPTLPLSPALTCDGDTGDTGDTHLKEAS